MAAVTGLVWFANDIPTAAAWAFSISLMLLVTGRPFIWTVLWSLFLAAVAEPDFPDLATPMGLILEKVCDTLSAMARLVGVPIPLPSCIDRYTHFEQFPELPTEVRNMVLEAIGRTEKPQMQFLAFGAKPIFYDLSNNPTKADCVLELKNGWRPEQDLWLRLANMPSNSELEVANNLFSWSPGWIRHCWFRRQEQREAAEVEQVNGITYDASQRAVTVLPVRCPYIDDSQPLGVRGDRCRGRQECFAKCHKRQRFSHKRDIIAPIWPTVIEDFSLDGDESISTRFCDRMPALKYAERIAVISGRPDPSRWPEQSRWDYVKLQLSDCGWPGHAPKLRELFAVCLGDIESINGGVLPAPFHESGGLKLTELEPTQHRFTSKFNDENQVFQAVRDVQELLDKKYHYDLGKWVSGDPSQECSPRHIQIKVVQLALRDASLFNRCRSAMSQEQRRFRFLHIEKECW